MIRYRHELRPKGPTFSPGQGVNMFAMRSGLGDASLEPLGVAGCFPGSSHRFRIEQVRAPDRLRSRTDTPPGSQQRLTRQQKIWCRGLPNDRISVLPRGEASPIGVLLCSETPLRVAKLRRGLLVVYA